MPEANDAAQPAVKLELPNGAQTRADVVTEFLRAVSSGRAFYR